MKITKIAKAIGYIDDEIISDAAIPKKKKKNTVWMKWCACAACLCIIIVGAVIWKQAASRSNNGNNSGNMILVSENGVTIPEMKMSLASNVEADMIGFFIYQGNCYVQNEWIESDADIVGEYLGTAVGLIDEWTPKDGYVELAGSVRGDFYSVKGYDPSFMLCMKYDTGVINTYIRNSGITLKYGSELFEDRLQLSGNYNSVQYETREAWYESKNERYQLDVHSDAITEFINTLDSSVFMSREDIKSAALGETFSQLEEYHLYFNMQNGTTVHLRLLKGGYIFYQGLLSVCVQIPEVAYTKLIETFTQP